MDKGLRVLIIDDELHIRKLLKVSLSAHGYELDEAVTGSDGLNRAVIFKPDIMIIDLGLPDMDGKAVIKAIREWSNTPIIILSVRDQELEKAAALDAGADDYVTKPFSMVELMARMRVSLRRVVNTEAEPLITCQDLVIDLAQRRVMVKGQEIKLTPTEYELIKLLVRNRGKVLTHRQLLKSVWGKEQSETDTHYVRIYIGQLRRKIEENPAQPRYIITESGIGYRFMC